MNVGDSAARAILMSPVNVPENITPGNFHLDLSLDLLLAIFV